MTPDDLALDISIFHTDQPRILYRYARKKFANLSGVGAALAPGRWNRLDQKAIYTSTEKGVPMLERLVHTPKGRIPRNLALMEIVLSGTWAIEADRGWGQICTMMLDRETEARLLVCPTLIKARLVSATPLIYEPVALVVPSVIAPVWNIVLYPRGKAFRRHVKLKSVTEWEFDPRLFPEDAVPEDI